MSAINGGRAVSNNTDVMPDSGKYNSHSVCPTAEMSTLGEQTGVPFKPFGGHCLDCGDYFEADDISVEEFEESGDVVCRDCADERNEQRDEDNSQFGVGA